MKGFKLQTSNQTTIHFQYYWEAAPITCQAFSLLLPFKKTFYHARVSGQEIWMDNAAPLDIIQENSSVFTVPGEVVYGPLKPTRNKTSNCMGIYYGEGKGLDACNIFASVFEEDKLLLEKLGNDIWENGFQELSFFILP